MTAFAGSFLCPTAAGTLDVSCGFTPNLIIFLGGDKIEPAGYDSSESCTSYYGAAILDDSNVISQCCTGVFHFSGLYPSEMIEFASTDCAIHALQTGGTDLFKASVTAFGTNGFTLTFSAVDASNSRRAHFIAYQLETAQLKIGTITCPSSSGTQAITGVGFTPQAVIFLPFGTEDVAVGFPNAGLPYLKLHGIGFDDGITPVGICNSYLHADAALAGLEAQPRVRFNSLNSLNRVTTGRNGDTQIRHQAKVQSFDSDGFTLNYSTASGTRGSAYYIAILNTFTKTGVITRSGTSTANNSITTGFLPDGVIAIGANQTSSSNADGAGTKYLGAASSTTQVAQIGHSLTQNPTNITVELDGENTNDCLLKFGTGGVGPTGALKEVQIESFDTTGFTVSFASASSGEVLLYFALGNNPASEGPQLIINDMELAPGQTHYMTVGHKNAAVAAASWTTKLLKDGILFTDATINIVENASKVYTFSFVNDGTHDSQWTLVVYETASPTNKYVMTWKVYKKIVEQNVKLLRGRINTQENQEKS